MRPSLRFPSYRRSGAVVGYGPYSEQNRREQRRVRLGKRLLDGPVDPIANFGQQAGCAPAGTRTNLDHGAVDPAYRESLGIGGRRIVQPKYPANFQILAFGVQRRERVDVDPSASGTRSVGFVGNRVGGPDVKRERPPFVGIRQPDDAPGNANLDPLLERIDQGRLCGLVGCGPNHPHPESQQRERGYRGLGPPPQSECDSNKGQHRDHSQRRPPAEHSGRAGHQAGGQKQLH